MNAHLRRLIDNYPDLASCTDSIQQAYELIRDSYRGEGKLLICGNGGSAADSEHIVGELMKGFLLPRPIPDEHRQKLIEQDPEQGGAIADRLQRALPAIALTGNPAFATAYQNDVAAEMVFAQQVYGYGRSGDVVLALSTSGNSVNVIHALMVAQLQGLRTVGLTGRDGGRMNDWCDVVIRVPYDRTPEIQERHLPVYHALCIMLEDEFFGHLE